MNEQGTDILPSSDPFLQAELKEIDSFIARTREGKAPTSTLSLRKIIPVPIPDADQNFRKGEAERVNEVELYARNKLNVPPTPTHQKIEKGERNFYYPTNNPNVFMQDVYWERDPGRYALYDRCLVRIRTGGKWLRGFIDHLQPIDHQLWDTTAAG